MRLIQYSSTGFVNIDKIDRIEVGLLVRFMCANDSEFVDVEKDFAVSFINQIQFNIYKLLLIIIIYAFQ